VINFELQTSNFELRDHLALANFRFYSEW